MSTIEPQSVQAIAKKDFQDAVRSHLFMGLSLLFFTMLVAPTVFLWHFEDDLPVGVEGTTVELFNSLLQGVILIVPLIAIVLGWRSIAGERQSGSIKVLLSLPHSRTDVLVGKLIGRSAVLSFSLVIGFLLAGAVVWLLLGSFYLTDFTALLAFSILLGTAYTSITITISALAGSRTVAAAGAFGLFVLFYIGWDLLVTFVSMLLALDVLPESDRVLEVLLFLHSLDPSNAFGRVLAWSATVVEPDRDAAQALLDFYDGSLPFYLEDWFGLVVLALWVIIPLVIAIYHFDRVDL